MDWRVALLVLLTPACFTGCSTTAGNVTVNCRDLGYDLIFGLLGDYHSDAFSAQERQANYDAQLEAYKQPSLMTQK